MGQVFYEDVSEGMEIPPLLKHPTTRQLAMWAGASGDFYEIHYDKDFARVQGLDGVIVHGRLKAAFIGQLITDWIGAEGSLTKLTCQYRGIDVPWQDITVRGKVTRKYIKDGENCVELEVWTENPKGEKTTPGTALVVLPSRSQS
jgi:acyl dehydratase